MTEYSSTVDVSPLLSKIEQAANRNLLSAGAVDNLRVWLTDDRYAAYRSQIADHIVDEKWETLDDVFWTVIPFGTGGRRGRMYPFGSNAINERTIGESAQGLASYVKQVKPAGPWSCAIAYDTRHRSREFAELCAGILVANGFEVFFIDDFRSTPELSYLVRFKKCDCGIMVTASHNPPSDNAVKIYWSNGGQLIPPHDKAVIQHVMQVRQFDCVEFDPAVDSGHIHLCQDEVDRALLGEHLKLRIEGPRDIRIIYSPLHGVGEFNVKSLLAADGFESVEIYEPHREPNGDFPNVPGHISNPENPQVFQAIIERAKQTGAELVLATDPDCDRLGAAAPLTLDPQAAWQTLNGNQLAAVLCDFVLAGRRDKGQAGEADYVVTTLVTTQMVRRIAASYDTKCFDNNLVGFKWIAEVIDREGPQGFVFGTEESHGFLVGTYARDKDGAVACMLMSELAAQCKADGYTVHQKLEQLYEKFGYHAERLMTIRMEGSDGMRRMSQLMDEIRDRPPHAIGGIPLDSVRDHLTQEIRRPDGTSQSLRGPTDNLIVLETTEPGNYVAVRPSGTEPKIKMYLFSYVPPDQLGDLAESKQRMNQRLDAFEQDFQQLSQRVS